MAGYIKIHRKLLEWGWYNNGAVKAVFLHLLLTANFRPTVYHGRTIERGQAVFGFQSMADKLGITFQQARTAVDKLKKSGEITVWTNRQFSVATIVNYDAYQDDEQQTDNKRITNDQQTINKRLTLDQQTDNNIIRKKEGKKERNKEKIIKEKFGVFKNVLLTQEEYEKLKSQFPDYSDRIDRLSEYLASSGKQYKSHYATILGWARKDKQKAKKQGSVFSAEGASFDLDAYERKVLFDE